MNASQYERLVAQIIRGIRSAEHSPASLEVMSGGKNRIIGASDYKHQIDESFSYAGRLYIVECKHWKAKIGVAEVLVLASRKQDIRETKTPGEVSAIIVSQEGATSGAKVIAKHFNIEIGNARSGTEYGLRLGQTVFLAVQNGATLRDEVVVTVNGKVPGNSQRPS